VSLRMPVWKEIVTGTRWVCALVSVSVFCFYLFFWGCRARKNARVGPGALNAGQAW